LVLFLISDAVAKRLLIYSQIQVQVNQHR